MQARGLRDRSPRVDEVEGFFFGVPAPHRSLCFDEFMHDFRKLQPRGVTAARWAARVKQPVKVVRQRLDALVREGWLSYDRKTKRYAVRVVTTVMGSPAEAAPSSSKPVRVQPLTGA